MHHLALCTASCKLITCASSHDSSIEAIFEFYSNSLLPFFYRYRIFLLNSVSIPFWNYIKCAEWNNSQVWSKVVYITSLKSFKIFVIFVLEVHHAQEQAFDMP